MTDADTTAGSPATDPDAQPTDDPVEKVEEVSWDEAQAHFAERKNETRDLAADLGGGRIATFTVRGLDDDEQADVEQASVNVKRKKRRRGEDEINLDSQAMKDTMLKYGIVSGPDGFKPHREDHRQQLPPGVKDELVDEIEDLSSLDVAERDQFP
jgi:hypothetical protein